MFNLILVSPLPPPWGGMTTFTSSLLSELEYSEVNTFVVGSRNGSFFIPRLLSIPFLALFFLFRFTPPPPVYINSSRYTPYVLLLTLYFNLFGFKTILSLHHGVSGQS